MKSNVNGVKLDGHPVHGPHALAPFVAAMSVHPPIGTAVPDYVASGTVTLASGETVPCMEIGRTKNGYARLVLSDGREIKTDPAQYREAGSITPFFEAFPFARVPGMVPFRPVTA